MSLTVFGNSEYVALPKSTATEHPFGSFIYHTHPSYDWYYSRYGFNVPLDDDILPIEVLYDGRLPKPSPKIIRDYPPKNWFRIDPAGYLWKVSLKQNDDFYENGLWDEKLNYITIPKTGWWVVHEGNVERVDNLTLFGLLITDPSRDVINEFWASENLGQTLDWFSIKDIVQKINTDYPWTQETDKGIDPAKLESLKGP